MLQNSFHFLVCHLILFELITISEDFSVCISQALVILVTLVPTGIVIFSHYSSLFNIFKSFKHPTTFTPIIRIVAIHQLLN